MAGRNQHRFEKITKMLVERIGKQAALMAEGFKGESEAPPFSVKLSDDEMLQQYFAMTPEKWDVLLKEKGAAEVMDYSEAMQRLARKTLPGSAPTTIVEPTEQGQNRETAAQWNQQQGFAPPEPTDGLPPDAQRIVQNALQRAGVGSIERPVV